MRFGLCLPLVLWSALTAHPAYAAQPLRITLDPGHGGAQVGASYRFPDGVVLEEKTLTLKVAQKLQPLLEQAGFSVTVTRSTDAPVNADSRDLNGDGRVGLADELQARIDIANRAGSDLFVSICFNGSSDPAVQGTETFWNPDRPFSGQSRRLAELTQARMVADLAAAGYAPQDRGARTDTALLGGDAFFLLGPASATIARPSQMPAVIGESLFLTNAADATALRNDKVVDAVAQGYFDGIQAYVGSSARATTATAAKVSAPPAPPPASGKQHWSVYAITYRDTHKGRQLAAQAVRGLSASGVPASVRVVPSAGSSSGSNYLVVASGSFDTRQAALARLDKVRRAGYGQAYASLTAL